MLGIAMGTASSNGILLRGWAKSSVFTQTGKGNNLYVSTTAGDLQTAVPSGSGNIVRLVGNMIDDGNNIIYFNPDSTWVQIT